MTAELGQFALVLAFAVSLAQSGLLLAPGARIEAPRFAAGLHASVAAAALVLVAAVALVAAFIAGEPSLKIVGAHSNTTLPVAYRVAAAWSAPEGTTLLWATALAGWCLVLRLAAASMPPGLAGRALAFLGLFQAALLAVLLAASGPFAPRAPGVAPGPGLDPVLQDPALLLHLPLLVLGAAGLAVAFALAVPALLADRLEPDWARSTRPWVLAAWLFLTAGIGVGSHWSDREASWGGWWSWEPLPAAHLVAWLAATALVHLLSAAERSRPLVRWAAWLALAPLPLALLGGWLLRGGPAPFTFPYAPDETQAGAFLVLAAVVAGTALALLARRAPARAGDSDFEMISREAALAAGVLVMLCALVAVLLGLAQPFVAGALGLSRGVGATYFNATFVPLVVPGLALMGPAPRLRWGSESVADAAREAFRPAVAGLAAVSAAALHLDRVDAVMVTGVFLSAWIGWYSLASIALRLGRSPAADAAAGQAGAATGCLGADVAHFGVALLVAGATLAGGLEQSVEVAARPGATQAAGPLLLRAESAREVEGANYRAVRLRLVVLEGGRESVLEPEARVYRAGGLPTREPASHRGLARDVQVAIAGTAGDGAWILRVRVRPFMSLVWTGMLLVAAGGLVALARCWARERMLAGAERCDGPAGLALGGSP